MMKLLSVLTILAVFNGLGMTLKLNPSLAAELNSSIQQPVEQAQNCPAYRRCQAVGGSR